MRWAGEGKGKIIPAQVLSVLQGRGPVRQRSLSADLIFWLLCIKTKVTRPSRGHERDDGISYNYIPLEYESLAHRVLFAIAASFLLTMT
jgi:hypothetical protein